MLFRVDVEPQLVRAECVRRLIALYGARDQAHVERLMTDDGFAALDGDAAAATRRAEALRLAGVSAVLRAMAPIPSNFSDDHWWAPPAEEA